MKCYGVEVNGGVDEGGQFATGVAVNKTDWIIHPSTRLSLTFAKTCTQTTRLTSCRSFGMIVTVAPLPNVANTIPPGFSRINAPPPSDALMRAMMGVGSAVTVDVDVSVGSSVTLVRDGVTLGVRVGV